MKRVGTGSKEFGSVSDAVEDNQFAMLSEELAECSSHTYDYYSLPSIIVQV